MKNNTKEVKELKKQVLELNNQVKALQMLIYFHEMEDFATAQIKVLNDLTKLVEFNNAENK
jgi:hypothetical protein